MLETVVALRSLMRKSRSEMSAEGTAGCTPTKFLVGRRFWACFTPDRFLERLDPFLRLDSIVSNSSHENRVLTKTRENQLMYRRSIMRTNQR